ncbi:MAG: hypothetical protein DMF25_03585 [Verrucomicrobia bacterium]|nr:MAG: hypothetical protein DMF25_03585 [Verrucomicrobiota bacterium]
MSGIIHFSGNMNRLAIFSSILSILLAQGALLAGPPERSVSPSRQFIVYGADAKLRGAVSDLAEATKGNLLTLLQKQDGWKTPIVVNLQLAQASLPEIPPAALHFSQTGFGLKLQLDLTISSTFDGSLVERELLRAILLEMIYRQQPDIAPGTTYVGPPEWLLDGVLALAPGRDRAPLVEAVLLSDKIVKLEEFLRQRPSLLDSPARLLYRAYSLVLVQLIVDGVDGRPRLARYIDNLSRASNDPFADLKTQFPVLGDDAEKTWRSSVAELNAAQNYQLLTFSETERRLDKLLRGKTKAGPSTDGIPLEDLYQRKISPAERLTVIQLNQDLLLLAARANPLMRPIVREYQEIAMRLLAGKRKGLAKRFARLKTTRDEIVARLNDVDDYMNWFEATQSKTMSGVFVDYLKAANEPQTPRRRDALSVYLDSIEEQFQN